MKKSMSIFRKRAITLALIVSAIVYFPEVTFGKGAVIGYAVGIPGSNVSNVTDAQLDRLTHVMVSDLYPNAQGYLYSANLSSVPNQVQIWNTNQTYAQINDLVGRAHARGVKVSIVISHSVKLNFDYISTATQDGPRTNLVNQIVNFVTKHNLDGVDLDWEFPGRGKTLLQDRKNEWTNYLALLSELKNHPQLSCKRISIALSSVPIGTTWYPDLSVQQNILNSGADAFHLMTYDREDWPFHSDVNGATAAVNYWAGLKPSVKEKIHMGCAFYGLYMFNGEIDWENNLGVQGGPYVPYRTNGANIPNHSDNATTVADKVNYCYNNGYGGVFIWELNQDKIVGTTPELLNATWTANTNKGGYTRVTITIQPAATTNVVLGNISGNLNVAATAVSCVDGPNYQWYKNAANSNTGGTALSGKTSASFPIPTDLAAGTYYYYCIVNTKRSNAAKVIVAAPSITISTQPLDVAVNQGCITGSLSVVATANAPLTYQWFSNTTGGNTSGSKVTGATNASLPIPTTLTVNMYYYCELTSGATTKKTNAAKVTVTNPITITKQPTAIPNAVQGRICSSLSVEASTECTNNALSYQWYKNTTNSSSGGTLISGATGASYTIPANLTAGTYYYYCVVKSGTATKPSNVAKVVVVASPPAPVISGSTPICFNPLKTFSATNWYAGYYWDKSTNIYLSGDITSSSVSVSTTGNFSNGPGWVSVKDCKGTELTRYNITWVGPPSISISGPNPAPTNYGNAYYANPSNGYSGSITDYNWTAVATNCYSYGSWASIYFNCEGTFRILCEAKNTCGWGPSTQYVVAAYNYSPSPAYPNPVSDVLYVETGTTAGEKTQETGHTYDIRLYDAQGNQLRQTSNKGGTVQFNVSALPNGTYYLHIYDGVNSAPEIQQIMVEH